MLDLGPGNQQHAWGSFPDHVLAELEKVLPVSVERSLETGCGKTSIIFSNISKSHTVFAYDDRDLAEESSVRLYESHPLTKLDRIKLVAGPTQRTLPTYHHEAPYDIIMLDGPHGCPFVELEYYFVYPHLKPGGFLILDDVHIPTIGQFADVLKEDAMFEYHALVQTTLVLRRTAAKAFDPFGDGWYMQDFNRRRINPADTHLDEFRLEDGMRLHPMAKIVAERLKFEDVLVGADEQAQGTVSERQRHWLMDGLRYEVAGRRYSLSPANVVTRARRIGRRLRRLFGQG